MSDALTEKEIKKRNIEINILNHLQNYKRTLTRSNQTQADILRELSEHREKLDEVDKELNDIKKDLDESDDHLASISSFFGAVKSFFSHHEEKNKCSSESEDDEDDDIPRPRDRDTDEGESPVDPNDFQSVVNGEMREIKQLMKTLYGAAIEMNYEVDSQDVMIEQDIATCGKNHDQAEKVIKSCDKLLKE